MKNEMALDTENCSESIQLINDIDFVKKHLVYRLVNTEYNKVRLSKMPHITFGEISKIFTVILKQDDHGIASAIVTTDLADHLGMSVKEMDNLATVNTPLLFPPLIRGMSEIISVMLQDQGRMSHDDMEIGIDTKKTPCKEEMYVLSNSHSINGAGCMLYPDVLRNFADKMNENLYILPSSTHEIIMVPDNGRLSREALDKMVRDVNGSQVPINEILSEHVYYYDRTTNSLDLKVN